MPEPDYDNISVMEDLEPEPQRDGGSSHARELVLGLMLLFGMLAWAGWQGWHDESNRANYAQAQQAAAARQWDDALAHFTAAQGYKDADARASDVRKQVQQRDIQYGLAQQQNGQAINALQAARAVQTIQPGYKDTNYIVTEAEKRVYTDALNNVVALRTQANPPGLYYRDTDGWVQLQGSDRWSVVLSTGASDRIVYDVPGEGWKPPATVTATASPYGPAPGSPQLAGRRLMVMKMDGVVSRYSFAPLSLDPAQYNGYICGKGGVWAVRNAAQGSSYVSLRKYAPMSGAQLTYQPFSSPVTATVSLTGTKGGVVDLSQMGDRVPLAAYGQPVENQTNTVLYIAGPDGSHQRVLYSLLGKGGFDSAHLSPDGRHALLVTYEPVESATGKAGLTAEEKIKAILLDTVGNTPPVVLVETMKSVPIESQTLQYQELTIAATFLNTDQLWNKLFLAWVGPEAPNRVNVRLIDPGRPSAALLITSVEGNIQTELHGSEDANSGLLLTMINVPRSGVEAKPPTQTLLHITAGVSPSSSPTSTRYEMSLGKVPVFLDARIHNGTLIYSGTRHTQEKLGFSIVTVPLSEIGKPGTRESTLYDVTLPRDTIGPAVYGNYHLGSALLTYIAHSELIAHSYEGSINITLEKGVTNLFELDSYYRYHWFF